MKTIITTLFITIATLAFSQKISRANLPTINIETIANTAFEQGKITVKFNRYYFDNAGFSSNINQVYFNNYTLSAIASTYHLKKIVATFGNILKDETRIDIHKKYNLDLWFSIEFDSLQNTKQLIKSLQNTHFFEVVEPVYKKHLLDGNFGATYIPNDTRLNEQWHYNNTGQGNGKVGKDIKLLDAWDIETGKPSVVVALHDMGVQLDHPDLAQNMLPAKSFNFITNNNNINPGYHGTHTAGTIAAVNNNNIGVSGIAGGNGNANTGARIMSLQIFDITANGFVSGNFAESYVYASDNGACISSNSWAYDEDGLYELNVLDAIDYFIDNGGGNVLQGGLVIFAAGNVSQPIRYFPSSYDRVICVAATNNRDEKTWYSTYGNWVDIAAPGGEDRNGAAGQVLSTTVGSGYASDQGTSMACPHVAGVAALIVSKLAGKASASDVKEILLSTTDNIDTLNPNFIGLIGTGRLNAFKALQKAQSFLSNYTVNSVDSFTARYNCNAITLNWKKNSNNNNVVIIYSNKNNIGNAINGTQYSTGNSFNNIGKVIYTGNTSSFSFTPTDSMLHFFKIFSVDNNTYSFGKTADVVAPATIKSSGTITQNFDYLPLYPTQQWRTVNPDNDISWTHTVLDTANTGAGDLYSMCMYNYKYNTLLGAVDILTSPLIKIRNSDSIKLSFWYAYQFRNTGLPIADSFEVLISNNCGQSFTSLWKKAALDLATSPSIADSAFYPFTINKWKKVTIDLSEYKNNEKIQFAFKATNGRGNNLFLDNISVDVLFGNDVAIAGITNIHDADCDATIHPQIKLVNKGYNNISSAQIIYLVDGANVITTNWQGNLIKNDTALVQLNAANISTGNHTITIFINKVNNQNDAFTDNDTSQYKFTVSKQQASAVTESFETEKILPDNWTTKQNVDDEITWTTTSIAGKNSNKSIVMKNYIYRSKQKVDDLITPAFYCNKNYDSIFLNFDYAYALRRLSDSTFFDTLQIDYTKNCGLTWTTLWKKTGKSLTSFNQTDPEIFEFFPEQNQWKSDSMLVTTNLNKGDIIQIRFRNINLWGNDVYIDNVNLFGKFYPQGIKEKGYAIYPNPTTGILNIQHLQNPINLKSIELFNSLGRKIKTLQYNRNANTEIQINLFGLSSDVYFLRMNYSDKTIVEKIIKLL